MKKLFCQLKGISLLTAIAATSFLLLGGAMPTFAGNTVNLLTYTKHNGSDDQTGITKAFKAAGPNGTVIVPAGYTWLHSGVLTAPAGLKLAGGGPTAILQDTDDVAGAVELSGSGSSVANLTVQYGRLSGRKQHLGYPDSALSGSGIIVQSGTNTTINSVSIPSSADSSIAIIGSNGVKVSNCLIGSGFNSGVIVVTSENVQVTGNKFTDQVVTIVSGNNCTVNQNTFTNATGAVQAMQVSNSQFNNNLIQNGSRGANADFCFWGWASNVQISGNIMELVPGSTTTAATMWSQAVFAANLMNIASSGPYALTISGNTINGGCSFAAINIGVPGGNIVVSDNTLSNINTDCLGSKTLPGYGGILLSGCNATISGNSLNNINAQAITIKANPVAPPVSVQISDNSASNCFMYKFQPLFLHYPEFNIAVIDVWASKFKSLSITGNVYKGGGDPGYFVDCLQPGVVEKGNDGDKLPSYYAK